MTLLFVYILFLLIVYFCIKEGNEKMNKMILLITCFILAWLAGNRDMLRWADTDSYMICFDNTPTFSNFDLSSNPYGYSELGFYWLSVLIKSFRSTYVFYFFVIAAISIWTIYKGLYKYCCYPLLGMAIYIARFFSGRNLIQIRAGLAYAIVLLGIKYISERNWKYYFSLIFIAYQFHHSVIIAIPLYFITYIKIEKWHVILGLVIAFILGGFFQGELQNYVTDQIEDFDVGTAATYTTGVEVEQAKGLANPLIYFQVLILLVYTFAEDKVKRVDVHYYAIRAAYLYSTMILITFCMFVALSTRTSTLFATCEIFMLPSLLKAFGKNLFNFGYLALSGGISGIFVFNYILTN